jgi:hypothetical protein
MLTPNTNLYNRTHAYRVNPNGSGAKWMNANCYLEDNTLMEADSDFQRQAPEKQFGEPLWLHCFRQGLQRQLSTGRFCCQQFGRRVSLFNHFGNSDWCDVSTAANAFFGTLDLTNASVFIACNRLDEHPAAACWPDPKGPSNIHGVWPETGRKPVAYANLP